MLENDIKNLIDELKNDLDEVKNIDEMEVIRRKYFSGNGSIKLFLKEIKKISPEERKMVAPLIQQNYKYATDLFKEKEDLLKKDKLVENLESQSENLNYSIPKIGHLHPISKTIREMNKLFVNMGFSIMDGPEIEKDEFCFQRLNVPIDHPARDMQDTIYIKEPDYLLRTQTSSIESRALASYKPPFKIVSPGRVYRNESVNKSNHFIFHHYQGIVVVEKTSLKDLFGIFNHLFKKMYGQDVVIRFRNKYYPEVEPGVGPDMQCFNCQGNGCPLCKGVGWIEMGGAGIIHPKVMKMAGIDTEKWMGFAFGLGLDRWVMAKYNITDIRTLLGGNLGYKYYENESIIQSN
ncbi:MAG: Phenylalanyl-tRNA synthetase, alpha subunit [uncultured bacterium]|nr:MAG: Phenylalanyl-tRNA synthetase, alpha subunit [uncultured bacterium]